MTQQIPAGQAVQALAALGWTPGALAQAVAPGLLSVEEVAATLRISKRSVWALVAAERLPRVRLGRAVRFRAEDVKRLSEEGK